MNEQQQLIAETLQRLLTDLCTAAVVDGAEAGEWPADLWNTLTETGLTAAGLPESAGGAGGDLADSLLVLKVAGGFAAPVPLAEHLMAGLLIAGQGGAIGEGPVTLAAAGNFEINADLGIKGTATQVPFARWCDSMVVVAESANGGRKLCQVPLVDTTIEPAVNMAGEPRDSVSVDITLPAGHVFDAPEDVSDRIRLLGAATRCMMMVGALDSVLEMSVQYAMERNQFGRPISKFQAIQHQLANLAGEVAASQMAGHAVVEAFEHLDEVDIAIGKARIGEAVSSCTDIAHQVHGAMGYTMEHTLNHRTRRLWSWRDEFDNETSWNRMVGRAFLEKGAQNLWGTITSRR